MMYSQRNIKELPTPKEVVIKSLSEYVKLFSDEKFQNCIYRGEPTNYRETISSALRDGEYPFIQMKEDFRREINYKITDEERKNFLAFSQHHGIPTNLIDFSHSPLVALYFACQPFFSKDELYDSQRGFVYLMSSKYIDITDIVVKNEDSNILISFIKDEGNIMMEFYEKFLSFQRQYPKEFYQYFQCLYQDYQSDIVELEPTIEGKFPEYCDGNYEHQLEFVFTMKNKELLRMIEQYLHSANLAVLEYLLMLRDYLGKLVEYQETVWWLNCIPTFLYNPVLSFERGRNQQGLFIYQAFLSYDEDTYGTHIYCQQRIWPETVVVVENKERILEELDLMGINEKFIYGDFDSIARYIKKKYSPNEIGFKK